MLFYLHLTATHLSFVSCISSGRDCGRDYYIASIVAATTSEQYSKTRKNAITLPIP